METTGTNNEGDPPELTLKDRLVAWWEGYDLSALKRRKRSGDAEGGDGTAAAGGKPGARSDGTNRWGKPLWTANRIEVVEKLWGPGFTTPGGSDHVPYLVLPLGLNPAMSVLDLGAGLGGTTRTMAGKFGCWVAGLEGNPLLAREGMERSVRAGLNKHAPIEQYDPENFTYGRRVDAIVFKEGMYTVHDKDQLFDGIEVNLKSRGQILMTDYVVTDKSAIAGLERWAAKEPVEPLLWTVAEMANGFAQRNLDLRISEDITETHRNLILVALQGLREHLEKHSLDIATKANVMEEVELWAQRVAAFERGLKVFRFYAMKPPDGTSE
jgi:cyclopropane fatty-acyl-phospholipid synthase-like methyltransferase